MQEREAAAKMFKGRKGQQLARDIGKRSKTFVPGSALEEKKQAAPSGGQQKQDVEAIKVSLLKLFWWYQCQK